MRIVSLIPGATEIISSLGLLDKLVGVSHECDFPKEVLNLPKLTKSNVKQKDSSLSIHTDIKKILKLGLSVYEVDVDMLRKVKPDVIITQSQCSICAVGLKDVENSLDSWLLKETKLIDLRASSFKGIMEEILAIGEFLNVNKTAGMVVKEIYKNIYEIKKSFNKVKKKNVFCVEWLNPLMTSGNWMPDLLEFSNAMDKHSLLNKKSNLIDEKQIELKNIDLVIFMPCGFDIERTENELKFSDFSFMEVLKKKNKFIVDGNRYFNRPGPNLLESVKILCEIIHPNIFKPNPSRERWIKLNNSF